MSCPANNWQAHWNQYALVRQRLGKTKRRLEVAIEQIGIIEMAPVHETPQTLRYLTHSKLAAEF